MYASYGLASPLKGPLKGSWGFPRGPQQIPLDRISPTSWSSAATTQTCKTSGGSLEVPGVRSQSVHVGIRTKTRQIQIDTCKTIAYIYIYVYICVHVYTYIYMYILRLKDCHYDLGAYASTAMVLGLFGNRSLGSGK